LHVCFSAVQDAIFPAPQPLQAVLLGGDAGASDDESVPANAKDAQEKVGLELCAHNSQTCRHAHALRGVSSQQITSFNVALV
jgi:hypothetical protein